MEIEKKFLVGEIDFTLDGFKFKQIEQSYISVSPVIRLRKSDDEYFLTIKGPGRIAREEFELRLSLKQYLNLMQKSEEGKIIKTRYLIPLNDGHTAELDLYHGKLEGFKTVEVEFESVERLNSFIAPQWFGKDVSNDSRYSNNHLSLFGIDNLSF